MKLYRLPSRITGFFDGAELPRSLDGKAFKRACYLVAQMDGGSVEDIDLGLIGRSYYGATLKTSTDHLSVLCNGVHPFLAFVPPGSFGLGFPDLTFVTPVQVGALFAGSTEFQPLDADWLMSELRLELLADLAPAELEQVKNWRPERIGEVIFNYWD